jgi:hypothetical protein
MPSVQRYDGRAMKAALGVLHGQLRFYALQVILCYYSDTCPLFLQQDLYRVQPFLLTDPD